ncbi:MAG: hypothetical protein FWB96_10665 [Defluviitaleaceae bacterium]|nr:hypothetical protein [Defluviitaleaceae bacterium]MCL2263350.1 hypothetical protein [Defluviitaleaceae bacterium]
MYKKIEPTLRMSRNEASEHYPNSFIVMQMDSMKLSDDVGTVLYVGDNERELYRLIISLNQPYCGVLEGIDLMRNCLGGVVVSG